MNTGVDKYLVDGCMRCKFGATPLCKVNRWREELVMLRQIVLECGLEETIKWGVPCFMVNNGNVAVVSAFKDYTSLSFFKGVLLKDSYKILAQHGESSQAARLIKFTSPNEIIIKEKIIKGYILEAVDIEKSGKKLDFKQSHEPPPDELLQKFEEFPDLKEAFYALTPGRQRGYIIYFSQPRSSQSRYSRIEKCRLKILKGEGLYDRYKGTKEAE